MPVGDWIAALIMRGMGWHFETAGFASATDSPITGGGAGTVMDLDQPEFGISIPSGYCCIPHEIRFAVRPGLQTTDSHVNDILLVADLTAKWAGDGTVTAETPVNLRDGRSGGCPLPCFSAATADITDPVIDMELARATKLTDVQGTAATVNLMELLLNYEPRNPPIIKGPAAIYGYWGGSIAAVGYAQVNFIAFPASLIAGLI